jgi:hypothetical protein
MKTNFRTFVLASAALAAAAMATIPAVAETSATLRVPFSFTVYGRTLPAGDYAVVRSTNLAFVRLQSVNSFEGYSWTAGPSEEKRDRVVLRFNSESHALQSVQFGAVISPRLDKKWKNGESVVPIEVGGR